MQRPVLIIKEDSWYVAEDVSTSVTSEGETVEEAMANLKEALMLYYDDSDVEPLPENYFLTTMEVNA